MSTKCVVNLGYKSFVMDTSKALTLLELLDGCELYEEEWHSNDKRTTYHVYPMEELGASVKLLPTNIYNVAKLAGKPQK